MALVSCIKGIINYMMVIKHIIYILVCVIYIMRGDQSKPILIIIISSSIFSAICITLSRWIKIFKYMPKMLGISTGIYVARQIIMNKNIIGFLITFAILELFEVVIMMCIVLTIIIVRLIIEKFRTKLDNIPKTVKKYEEYKVSSDIHIKKDDILMDLKELQCSICIEHYKNDEIVNCLECKHIYHQECIKLWLENNNSCPICRNVAV